MSTYDVKFNGVVVGKVLKTDDPAIDAKAAQQLLIELGLHREISRAEVAMGQAQSFAEAAAQLHKRGFRQNATVPTTLAPFIVNCAFAIELYLKTLGEIHHVNLHGHRYLKLFDPLPESTRNRLEEIAPTFVKQYKVVAFSSFRGSLLLLEGAFVSWRYLHEKRDSLSFEVSLAIATMAALHERCRELLKAEE